MLSLRRRCRLAAVGVAVSVGGLLVWAGPAGAAFPGRNGLLAVQPLKGSGVVLVEPNGSGERRICHVSADGCFGTRLRPSWSADGRALALGGSAGGGPRLDLVYPDGSCLDCWPWASAFSAGRFDASFTPDPTLFTAFASSGAREASQTPLVEYGIDGLPRRTLLSGRVVDPVWSASGELAVARGGWVWVGAPDKLRRLIEGSAPSWSPGGRRIVFVRNGWLTIVNVRGGSVRRLVRGMAPAWSPDGRSIAYFDARDRLSVIPASGGRVRRVGRVTGRSVDWQPLPAKPPVSCLTPKGSAVIASSDAATLSVYSQRPTRYGCSWAAMGCLLKDGRERVLDNLLAGPNNEGSWVVSSGVLAGAYAALIETGGGKYCGEFTRAQAYDLGTGKAVGSNLYTGCTGVPSIDQLALGSDGVMALHSTQVESPPAGGDCTCTVEQIQASDSTGARTLDNASEPDGSPPQLTNLKLTGDTLTWEHNGSPREAELVP